MGELAVVFGRAHAHGKPGQLQRRHSFRPSIQPTTASLGRYIVFKIGPLKMGEFSLLASLP